MNLLLANPEELDTNAQLVVTDRRHQHLRQVNKIKVGDSLQAGVLNGLMGTAKVLEHHAQLTRLQLYLEQPPPAALPVTLILALPRPRMLARSLEHLTALGVKRLILLHSARVEKSYWQSPELQPEKIHQHLILGLEQAKDTLLPQVSCHKLFKPFVEDELPSLAAATKKLLAHPGPYPECPRGIKKPTTLAIGPEGGWLDYEVDKFVQQDFQPVQLGTRILRVETAITALLARLF